jgi:hypothetical protein
VDIMRVLLLHPEDSPVAGPWVGQHWDLLVDLGRSSQFSQAAWAEACGCPVLRLDCFRRGIDDVKEVRKMYSTGRGRFIDKDGIDWWDLTCLSVLTEALTVLALERLVGEVHSSAELWATRPGWPASGVAAMTGRSVRSFEGGRVARAAANARHYAELLRRFSAAQIKEIFLDKYDSGYRWRSRFASKPARVPESVVLLPSAYVNVSRVAAAYAGLLPQQPFLMVTTRRSGRQLVPPANVQVRDLAGYAGAAAPRAEIEFFSEKWDELKSDLSSSPEFRVLLRAGVLNSLPQWVRDGLCARDAWHAVLDREPVAGVLCGDDSNVYTRLPVLLAAKRKIPTVDFHHGAFDGSYLLKELPCDVYLAKNEMEWDYLVRVCGLPRERVMIGAPEPTGAVGELRGREKTSAIFFSEPYESAGMRGEQVYREILPALCCVARESGRGVIVKLHPFESRSQRCRMVSEILTPENNRLVTVLDGPLTGELLSRAWFGVTVESTTAVDCVRAGVCCFLCEWLGLSPFEYVRQYARFGLGEILQDARQIYEIPNRLAESRDRLAGTPKLAERVDPAVLQTWLISGVSQGSGMRSAS